MVKNKIIMKLKFIFGLVFLMSALFAEAQEIEPDPLEEYILKKRGPNKDRYGHLFLGYGFIVGDSEGDSAAIRPGTSSSFVLGWRSKWRINSWYELGFDASYHYSSFHIKQDSFKIVPNTTQHKREKLVFNAIELVPFQRFKIRNRDHSAGTFIDIGGYAGFNYRVKHQTVERNQISGSGISKTTNLRLKYTEDLSYGAIVRFGFNRVVLFGRYRVSDLFTVKSRLPELPRMEFGISLGIHQ